MQPLEPSHYYHICNRANGWEKMFFNDENYYFFLQRYNFFIPLVAHTLAYCLMPNHLHFLVRIKDETESRLASKQFAKLFSSYTQSFNKVWKRKGSLFIPHFKRYEITSDDYLQEAITYIHVNPFKARLVTKLEDWKFSSYKGIITKTCNWINVNETIELFATPENFKFAHELKMKKANGEEPEFLF